MRAPESFRSTGAPFTEQHRIIPLLPTRLNLVFIQLEFPCALSPFRCTLVELLHPHVVESKE
jgi:hypothetical protein